MSTPDDAYDPYSEAWTAYHASVKPVRHAHDRACTLAMEAHDAARELLRAAMAQADAAFAEVLKSHDAAYHAAIAEPHRVLREALAAARELYLAQDEAQP